MKTAATRFEDKVPTTKRYYLILAKDLEYGDVSESSQLLEEVSKLLEAYSQAILNSDFCLLTSE